MHAVKTQLCSGGGGGSRLAIYHRTGQLNQPRGRALLEKVHHVPPTERFAVLLQLAFCAASSLLCLFLAVYRPVPPLFPQCFLLCLRRLCHYDTILGFLCWLPACVYYALVSFRYFFLPPPSLPLLILRVCLFRFNTAGSATTLLAVFIVSTCLSTTPGRPLIPSPLRTFSLPTLPPPPPLPSPYWWPASCCRATRSCPPLLSPSSLIGTTLSLLVV